ncbi:predicted protein [Streptomyces sp. AA4]|nr:predicted protein [Streptomyces sp. AA4]
MTATVHFGSSSADGRRVESGARAIYPPTARTEDLVAITAPRVLPGFDNIAGIAIPAWAGMVITAACAVSAIVVLLVIVRNRRK